MSFARGLIAPFRGVLFVARHRLWSWVVLPALLNAALAVGAAWGAVRLARRWLPPAVVASDSFLMTVAQAVVVVLLGFGLFLVAQPVLSAPFVDLLTEKVETIVKGTHPRIGLARALWQAVLHGVLKLLLYGGCLLVVLALTVTTGVGGALGLALYALFLAFDGFDYPLARRGVGFLGKWRYLVLHPGQTFGYCLGASLLYLVPLAIVAAPAFAAVGATLAYLDDTAPDGARGAAA